MPSLNSLTEEFFAQRPELFDPEVPDLPVEDLKEMFRLDLRKALRQALNEAPGSLGASERFDDPDAEISVALDRLPPTIPVGAIYRRAFHAKAIGGNAKNNKAAGELGKYRTLQVKAAVHRWIANQKVDEQQAYTKAYSRFKNKRSGKEDEEAGKINQPFSAIVDFVLHGIRDYMDSERDDGPPVIQAPVLPEDLRLAMRFAAPLMDTTQQSLPALDDDEQDSPPQADSASWPVGFEEILKSFRDKRKAKATPKEVKEAEERYCVPFGIFSEDQRNLVVRAAFLLASEVPYQRFKNFIAAHDQRLQEAAESSPRLLVSASLSVLIELSAPGPQDQDATKDTATAQMSSFAGEHEVPLEEERESSTDWEEVVGSGVSDQDDPKQEDPEEQSGPAPEQDQSTKQQSTSGGSKKEPIIPASLDFLRVVGGVAGAEPGPDAVCGWCPAVLEQSVQEWAGGWLPGGTASTDLLGRLAGALPLATHDDDREGAASKPWYGTTIQWNPVGRDIFNTFQEYSGRERVTDHDLYYEVLPALQDTVRLQTLRVFVRRLIRDEHKGELFEDRGVLSTNSWLKKNWRSAFNVERKRAATGYSRLMTDVRTLMDPAYIPGSDVSNPVYRRTVKQLGIEAVNEALGGQPLRPYGLTVLGEENDHYRWNLVGIPLPYLDDATHRSLTNSGWTRYVTSKSTPVAEYIRRALEHIVTTKEPLVYHPINTQAMELCDGIAGETLHQAAVNLQSLEQYVREQRSKKASFRGLEPFGALQQMMGLDPQAPPTPELETAHLLYQCLFLDAITLTHRDMLDPQMLTN